MLIDDIIVQKTKYTPKQFTGGNIQISTSTYTKLLSIKLVLYFGYNTLRNPISKQLNIREEDVETILKELIIKSKNRIEILNNQSNGNDLDLSDIRNESLGGYTSDSDKEIKEIEKIEIEITSEISDANPDTITRPYIPTASEFIEVWNTNAQLTGLNTVRTVNATRMKKIKTRILNDDDFLDNLIECMHIAKKSSLIQNGNWFTLDWLIANELNYTKVLEGNYNDKK